MTAIEQTPDWPTAVRSRLNGGRVLGVDNSVWLYRTVPLAPVVDAASPAESVEPAEPILAAFEELAAITSVGLKRRAASKGNYRRIHLLLVNLPWEYDPAPGPISEYLADSYRGRVVDRRVLMFGVRLVDKIGNRGGLRAAVDSVVETLVSGGRPISDFDVDTAAVEAALTRSGLATPTTEEFAAVEAWWNHGVHADTPVLEHTDHLHVFSEIASVETAAAEPLRCANWPPDDGRHAITFATVKEFDGGVIPVDSPAAWWVPALLAEGALAVSIRGLIEPCEITREELRRRKKQILDDLRERATADKLERSEQDEMFQMVTAVEADYAGPVPPTLVDASVLVAFDGKVGDMAEVARGSGLLLRSMDMRQRQAWAETMIASAVSANPYLHDLPAQLIACSGLPSLSRVGDADGAQLGFTERDRQPVFLSPEAASKSDSAPLVLVAGSTGSGKACTLETPIPTPTGWTTMGELKVGDRVFGRDGQPCKVLAVYDHDDLEMYDVRLSDGQVIRSCADHRWLVETTKARRAAQRSRSTNDGPRLDVVTTAEMRQQGLRDRNDYRFSIPTAEPVDLPEAPLPVDPYIYGAWLGDGVRRDGYIVAGDQDVDAMLRNVQAIWPSATVSRARKGLWTIALKKPRPDLCPYGHDDWRLTSTRNCRTCARRTEGSGDGRWNVSLHQILQAEGLNKAKRIPEAYENSSVAQRLALLQGLMDTDGHVTKAGGECQLRLHDRDLIEDAVRLIRSLGIKVSLNDYNTRKGRTYVANFSTTLPVFRLPRKAEGLRPSYAPKVRRFGVVDIVAAGRYPGRCIQVDSPDNTYLVHGFIPTHNTMVMLWAADQFARSGSPVVMLDPKASSDHSAAVLASGGQVASLDSLTKADGVFDPLRFAISPEAGVDMAGSLLLSVNPWGSQARDFEVPLMRALRYGVDNGATCIGEALKMAERNGKAPADLVRGALDLAEASPLFRACLGINPGTDALRVADGITLIKVGDTHLELPEPGIARADLTPQQRVAMALVRMMVFGSATALTGRKGVLLVDEAWTVLSAGRSEVERLGRLARSQQVLPMLFTQRVSDAVDANLTGYISRGIILPLSDPAEAQAACELFGLEPTPERIARITEKATIGGGDNSHGASMAQPNWRSMRHLRDPNTGATLRGTVAIYADLAGRAVPVEIAIPQSFIAMASTNPDDIRRRLELGP